VTDADHAVPVIRVALVGLSRLSTAAVSHVLAGQEDIMIVEDTPDTKRLVTSSPQRVADVVVTTGDPGVPDECRRTLFAELGVPVIAIHAHNRLVIYDRHVRKASTDELLAVIRRIGGPPPCVSAALA
jgi:hypothetical protein